ncbi:MAG: hypothetical protein KAS23_09810, partial [Anaerohalosphaera sp.]|nr:hypothetical protein [Anaerohalosphaera sp.]
DKIKENVEELFAQTASNRYDPYSYRRGGYGSSSNSEDTVKAISYPTLSQVTVIASEANMEKIAIQIAEWDVPLDIEKDQYRILTLRNSDPVQMVSLLTKLFSEDDSGGGSTRGMMRMIFGEGGGMDTQKQKIVGSLYGLLTFEAVPDTKKIIVISKISEAYDVIEKLVKELDSQEMAEVPKVIILKYADAEQLSEQLNAILNESGTRATIQRSDRGLSVDSDSSDAEKTGETTVQDNNNNSDITPWWDTQRTTDTEMPASNLIGNVRFVPVHRSKAIMVLAPPEYMEAIEKMIEELDQPGKQVMIKTVILSVDHSDMSSLGVQIATDPSAFGTLGENALEALTQMSNIGSAGSIALESSLNVSTLVDLLVKKIDAKVLNQPTLWTKDNEEAVFVKAKRIAFIVNEQSDRTNTNSTSRNYEYSDVGVTLRVRPNITPERSVDTSIYLEVSTIEDDVINFNIATNRLDMTTNVIVGDGETILLGGILFQNDSMVERKVPLLGDIPFLGNLFRHKKTDQVNSELLVFITPYVVDGDQTTPEALKQIEGPKARLDEVAEQLSELFSGESEE